MKKRLSMSRHLKQLAFKVWLIICTSASLSHASVKELKSYQANFTQTIIDQDDVKIVYKGTFLALKPLKAVWHYDTPVKKSVYVNSRQIVIVEPELEQAIYKESKKAFTLFNILDGAKKLDNETYEKVIGDRTYKLKVKKENIQSLSYNDNFDNKVSIIFTNQKPNLALKSKAFHPIISEDFDIIKE
jgi:outer membrane lipoprotein carrier protein